jgi:tRNA (mo5U34)-methyltransferase
MRTLQSDGNESLPRELAPWFHNLHLPGGLQTAPDHPLGDFPRWKWEQIAPHLPLVMSGMRVLDIGCNAGFYSFELARRGADVLAVDVDEHYLAQARWADARVEYPGRIEFRQMGVYELAGLEERFDLVLLLGVLYHLRHPLLALDLVADATEGLLVLQTLTMPGGEHQHAPEDLPIGERDRMLEPGWPKMAFIEHELAGDATNWWAPSAACVEAMLRSCGLEVVSRPGHEMWVCEPGATRSSEQAQRIRSEALAATGRTADPPGERRRSRPSPPVV